MMLSYRPLSTLRPYRVLLILLFTTGRAGIFASRPHCSHALCCLTPPRMHACILLKRGHPAWKICDNNTLRMLLPATASLTARKALASCTTLSSCAGRLYSSLISRGQKLFAQSRAPTCGAVLKGYCWRLDRCNTLTHSLAAGLQQDMFIQMPLYIVGHATAQSLKAAMLHVLPSSITWIGLCNHPD